MAAAVLALVLVAIGGVFLLVNRGDDGFDARPSPETSRMLPHFLDLVNSTPS